MEFLRRLTEPAAAKAARERTRALVEAAMATAALVASADGPAGLAQRLLLDQILDSVESLRGNDPHVAVEIFNGFARAISESAEVGRARASTAISEFAGAPDTPRLLLHIANAMATAQGGTSANATAEIARVSKALGLPEEETPILEPDAEAGPCTVIVLGNEKGGTGKSTTALHLAVCLMARGHKVGTIDLDGHQGTLSRYIANRVKLVERGGQALPVPQHRRIVPSNLRDRVAAHADERAELQSAFKLLRGCRFVLVDTPGSHTHLSRLGLEFADTLITPLNDSFLDIDVLARIDHGRREIVEPSAYGRMVLDENDRRRAAGGEALDWIVMRNRLAHIDARNTREMDRLLRQLGDRMGFRLRPGLSERVVFRELFYKGLTLFDPPAGGDDTGTGAARALAGHCRARREVEDLTAALGQDSVEAGQAPV